MWSLAYELNVERAVDFLDYVPDQRRDCLYQIVDAAVFPSIYEPFGIVALEAMALGCNVIASDVGGLGAVVNHQKNGLTVLPNDPQSIVWAVNQLFQDPDGAKTRRAQALTDIKTIYRWENIASQTAQVYQRVVQGRAQSAW
jgi:glycosyltransferase involved in cell wall biosynthesis